MSNSSNSFGDALNGLLTTIIVLVAVSSLFLLVASLYAGIVLIVIAVALKFLHWATGRHHIALIREWWVAAPHPDSWFNNWFLVNREPDVYTMFPLYWKHLGATAIFMVGWYIFGVVIGGVTGVPLLAVWIGGTILATAVMWGGISAWADDSFAAFEVALYVAVVTVIMEVAIVAPPVILWNAMRAANWF